MLYYVTRHINKYIKIYLYIKLNNSILIVIVGYDIKDTKYLESLNKYLIYDPKLKDYTIEIAVILENENFHFYTFNKWNININRISLNVILHLPDTWCIAIPSDHLNLYL